MSLSVRRRLRRRYLTDTCQMSRGPSPFPKSFLPDHLGFSVWNPFCAEYQSQKPHLLPPSSLSGPISLCVSSRYGSVGFIYRNEAVRKAFQCLCATHRQILIWVLFQNHSFTQIARITHHKPEQIRQLYHFACMMMRQNFRCFYYHRRFVSAQQKKSSQ